MSAEYVARGLMVQAGTRSGVAPRWTLELVVAGAFLAAIAELGVLQQYPEVESQDAAALVTFGQAALDTLPGTVVAPGPFAAFDFQQRILPDETRP